MATYSGDIILNIGNCSRWSGSGWSDPQNGWDGNLDSRATLTQRGVTDFTSTQAAINSSFLYGLSFLNIPTYAVVNYLKIYLTMEGTTYAGAYSMITRFKPSEGDIIARISKECFYESGNIFGDEESTPKGTFMTEYSQSELNKLCDSITFLQQLQNERNGTAKQTFGFGVLAGSSNVTTAKGSVYHYDGYGVLNYYIPDRTITVTKNINGGTVTGSTTIEAGNIVTISAQSDANHIFKGWSTTGSANEISITSNTYTFMVTNDVTFTAIFEEKKGYVSFDNLINFIKWKHESLIGQGGTVSNITDTGFSLTCNSDSIEGCVSSPYFKVIPGESYKIDIDIEGNNWDVYIFFCDANGTWIDFQDSANRFSSNGGGISSRVFTAPNKTEVTQAQIRIDANNPNNTILVDNIRVYPSKYEYMSNILSKNQRNNYATWNMPTPSRNGYLFGGWFTEPEGQGTYYTSKDAFPTVLMGNVVLYSYWEEPADSGYIQLENSGTVANILIGNQYVQKAYIDNKLIYTYTPPKVVCTYGVSNPYTYGFTKDSSGWFVSNNKGKASSYALCRINLYVYHGDFNIYLDCINYAETNYDYGLIGKLDTALSASTTVDDSSKLMKNFKGSSSSSTVRIGPFYVSEGTHFIDVKFRKDSSGNSYNDTLKFKVIGSAVT